jgi:very-short-patch-repair endonuclease
LVFVSWKVVAARQAGLIGTAQLVACGCSPSTIRSNVRAGRLVPVRRGVYRLAGPAFASPTVEADLWAAVLAAGTRATAWRRSAAWWWGLDGVGPAPAEVAVGPSGRRARTGVTRVNELSGDDRTVLRGLPVTVVGRTLADLGSACPADVVERALECALRRRLVTLVEVEQRSSRSVPARSVVLREVLRRRPEGAPPTESDAETRFLQLVRRAGWPDPVRQLPLVCRGRRFRLDAAWPRRRLAVEVDGAATHATADALGRDLRRQNALVLDGWTVLRFTWEDIVRYPDEVIELLDDRW